ncbi:hypothetical protein HYX00_06550 [Candidatus Woesearchaeota archaeon]|nr:hypothetical protein [Candidatus Woesearchaeota archaeon]
MVLRQLTKEEAKEEIDKIIQEFKKKLTLDGKSRVFENQQRLASEFIIDESDPEDLTRDFLIDKILFDILKLELNAKNIHFRAFKELRKVDYALKINDKKILLEAKPINADLFDKSSDSAVNQIKGIFRLAEVKENYEFGVASDGLQWAFIDKNSNVVNTLNIFTDFEKIREINKFSKK